MMNEQIKKEVENLEQFFPQLKDIDKEEFVQFALSVLEKYDSIYLPSA